MKKIISIALLSLLLTSCSHQKVKTKRYVQTDDEETLMTPDKISEDHPDYPSDNEDELEVYRPIRILK